MSEEHLKWIFCLEETIKDAYEMLSEGDEHGALMELKIMKEIIDEGNAEK